MPDDDIPDKLDIEYNPDDAEHFRRLLDDAEYIYVSDVKYHVHRADDDKPGDNDRDASGDYYRAPDGHWYLKHDDGDYYDKPDVEFNDDGSVRVNTPGDYYFAADDHGNVRYAHRVDVKPAAIYSRDDRTSEKADDPARG